MRDVNFDLNEQFRDSSWQKIEVCQLVSLRNFASTNFANNNKNLKLNTQIFILSVSTHISTSNESAFVNVV